MPMTCHHCQAFRGAQALGRVSSRMDDTLTHEFVRMLDSYLYDHPQNAHMSPTCLKAVTVVLTFRTPLRLRASSILDRGSSTGLPPNPTRECSRKPRRSSGRGPELRQTASGAFPRTWVGKGVEDPRAHRSQKLPQPQRTGTSRSAGTTVRLSRPLENLRT